MCQAQADWFCALSGGRLLVHVPVAGAAAKQKESKSSAKRKSVSPGTLVSGVVLHVHVDQATLQLSDGEQS